MFFYILLSISQVDFTSLCCKSIFTCFFVFICSTSFVKIDQDIDMPKVLLTTLICTYNVVNKTFVMSFFCYQHICIFYILVPKWVFISKLFVIQNKQTCLFIHLFFFTVIFYSRILVSYYYCQFIFFFFALFIVRCKYKQKLSIIFFGYNFCFIAFCCHLPVLSQLHPICTFFLLIVIFWYSIIILLFFCICFL